MNGRSNVMFWRKRQSLAYWFIKALTLRWGRLKLGEHLIM